MAKSNEPIWWSLFSAGGMAAAMLIPGLILATGLILPLGGGASYDSLRQMVEPWFVRLGLGVVVSLCFFHWAHRFRFTLLDLGIHSARTAIAVLCYGGAIAGTVVTGFVLF